MTTAPSLAVEPKAISISQYEALNSDIEIAKQGVVESFDYNDPKGEKAARSYIAGLRKIRSRIESARKEAKSYALEYGRAVDGQAKALEAEILGLIEPHQQALDEIAQREKDRVARHEARLQEITSLVQEGSAEGARSGDLQRLITRLEDVQPTVADMEEFREAAMAEVGNGLRLLRALYAAVVEREKREAMEAAEAQRLAEEEAARRKAEEEARVQAQIKEAEERARQAEERAAAADAQRVRQQQEMEQAIRESDKEQQRRAAAQREAEAALRRAEVTRRNDLAAQLAKALTGKTKTQVVELLLDGQLHPAVVIDWSKA